MEPNQHGPDGLYDKFRVFRARTGEELTNRGEFIFVLRPESNDRAAQAALIEYARVCESSYPQLSQDILKEIRRIRGQVERVMFDFQVSRDEAYKLIAERRPDPPSVLPCKDE